ncbi:hypothetical protein [Leptolyngbya sp. FACHB-671]|nr:hypothetical protein [Leptolyngbya sp. FACHB-671]
MASPCPTEEIEICEADPHSAMLRGERSFALAEALLNLLLNWFADW